MQVKVYKNNKELGKAAAAAAAKKLNEVIAEKGCARLLLSTGASQFDFFEALRECQVDWSRVEMFHLDEYVGISAEHPASFNKYLRKRFVDVFHPGKYHLMDGERDPEQTIAEVSAAINEAPIDLGLIGIGENGHIAFNDPPADFDDERAYKVVTLNDACLRQQVREGWFESPEAAFKQAISMTCRQIMKCECIISVVPHAVKAQAIHDTLTCEINENVPATLLKNHKDVTVYCDENSASLTDAETLARFA